MTPEPNERFEVTEVSTSTEVVFEVTLADKSPEDFESPARKKFAMVTACALGVDARAVTVASVRAGSAVV